MKDFFFSKGSVAILVGAIIWLLTNVAPVLPTLWGNLATAVAAVLVFYFHGNVVKAARAQGVKGI